jgi:hypothetical protein
MTSKSGSIRWRVSAGEATEVLEEAPPVIDPKDAMDHRRRGSERRRRYQPTLDEVSLEVVPAADGKVKLKSSEDRYVMAELHYYYDDMGTVYTRIEDSNYMKDYANRSLWTVVDLGPLTLPVTEKHPGCRYSLCLHAGPPKPACEVLG